MTMVPLVFPEELWSLVLLAALVTESVLAAKLVVRSVL